MGQFADALRRLQQNPEDLSELPQLIAQVEQVEDSVTTYQQNISTLQDINKKYLAQIPVPGELPGKKEEEPEEPTFEDAKAYLVETLGGSQ